MPRILNCFVKTSREKETNLNNMGNGMLFDPFAMRSTPFTAEFVSGTILGLLARACNFVSVRSAIGDRRLHMPGATQMGGARS
jgi:hypothetical protein